LISYSNEISFQDAVGLNYDPKFKKNAVFRNFDKSVKFYLSSIDKDDLENLIHIYYNDEQGFQKRRYGWALFDGTMTKLSTYTKLLYSKDFLWEPTSEQKTWNSDFDRYSFEDFHKRLKWMKQTLENYNKDVARQFFWMIVGTSQTGPFMIVDGVNRAMLTYMYHFIQNKGEFTPIEKVVCCISSNTNLPYFRSIEKLI